MKRTNIGGQAVIEGVMMRGKKMYAVAVRKPDQDIIIDKKDIKTISDKIKLFKLPIFRGMLAFVESMIIGIKTLTYSADFFEVEESEPSKFDKFLEKVFGDKLDSLLIGISVCIAILFGVGVFMVLPMFIARFFENIITQNWVLNTIEGLIRILIFLCYIVLISKMNDIKRVFQYHGAEHKTISCLEHEEELTVENAKKHSRLHKRCGTNFLFIVMIISILVFGFIRVDSVWIKACSRILLVPIIAGISYEVLKWAGRNDNKVVDFLNYPGLCLQKITTSEPDDKQLEVAIAAIKGVLEDEPEDNN